MTKTSSSLSKVRIKDVFLGLQDQMSAKLSLNRRILKHPVSKGDASELEWVDMLSEYLPKRYQVEKAFVIDYKGNISGQIDIVIFDRHFSPFLLKQNGATYVPAESVYAVIEVKPKLNKQTVNYAADKALSVRRLERTSAPIVHAGGKIDKPKKPFKIFAGIVTLDGKLTKNLEDELLKLQLERHIDIGCSLETGAFVINCLKVRKIEKSTRDSALIFFFLKLLVLLQGVGTVSAMNIDKYIGGIK